jgi:hypothetical protein
VRTGGNSLKNSPSPSGRSASQLPPTTSRGQCFLDRGQRQIHIIGRRPHATIFEQVSSSGLPPAQVVINANVNNWPFLLQSKSKPGAGRCEIPINIRFEFLHGHSLHDPVIKAGGADQTPA